LAEQVLEILPSDAVGKLRTVNAWGAIRATTWEGTNVCDVELAAGGAAGGAAEARATKVAAGGAVAAAHAAGSSKAGLRFTVLSRLAVARAGLETDFADVDESAHQLLVGECGHGILSLLSRSILHNSDPSASLFGGRQETHPHPYMNHGQPVQPVNPTVQTSKKPAEPARYQPTFDIPFGRSRTSA
jgi:hypothetical protein